MGWEKERDVIRGNSGFLQNVAIEPENINPFKYLQKGNILGCVSLSAGVDCVSLSVNMTIC